VSPETLWTEEPYGDGTRRVPRAYPLAEFGWVYHAPEGPRDATYWTRIRSRERHPTQAVAEDVGLSTEALLAWENAVDLEMEAELRANDEW